MSEEFDAVFGPGTDLAISLFAVTLMVLGILSGLYFDSVNSLEHFEAIFGKNNSNDILKRYEFFKQENDNLKEKIKLLSLQLKELNSQMEDIEEKNNMLESQLIIHKLPEGHENTPVPRRSTAGKKIYRLYAEGSSMNPELYLKSYKSKIKMAVSNRNAHEILQKAQEIFGPDLYIAVIVSDTFSVKTKRKLECEFWEYDYYQYFDKSYCQGFRE
jgi:hypothetical protein